MENKNEKLEKVLDLLGEILGFLTVVLYAVLIINGTWQFIPQGTFYNILVVAKSYAALAVVAIVGLEAAVKRGFLFKLVFLILLAIIVIFQFFPGTWANVVSIF
ncbi:MAG: hypothetical protein IKI95_01955 [Clostridia bacterium]|nr:hypothetical protein [Clostridia bacterium]